MIDGGSGGRTVCDGDGEYDHDLYDDDDDDGDADGAVVFHDDWYHDGW